EKALSLKPDYADAAFNRANSLMELGRFEEALAGFDKAIALNPNHAAAFNNRGNALAELQRYEDAVTSYRRAIEINPDLAGAEGAALYARMHICDWMDFEQTRLRVVSRIAQGIAPLNPHAFLSISFDPLGQLECARLRIAERHPAFSKPIWSGQ